MVFRQLSKVPDAARLPPNLITIIDIEIGYEFVPHAMGWYIDIRYHFFYILITSAHHAIIYCFVSCP